jgi:alcohol dehydrogenase class IV
MRKQGILDRALRVLRDSGIACTDFQEVEADPSLATVTGGVRRVSEFRGDLVIGLGGGSAIDAGKAIASMVRQPQSVYAYFDGAEIELPGLPFIAIPTTAGTGAEVTSNAVLTDERCQRKRSLRSPLMTPGTAIVDPELTRSMSPYLTACTGMDALVQAIEAFVTSTPNPVSDVLSSRAIVLITEALPGAVQEGDDAEARVQMALGSLLSGMAFSTSGLGAVHGLAHPIGARFGAPHGHICAILLPAVMRFNLPARRDRFGEIAGLIGLGSAEALIQRIEELLGEVGLLMDLKAWGITQDDLPAIVAESRSGSMGKNPRQASDEELVGLLMELT